ncbi:MAG: hypothetical protein L0I76_24970 [Pseudonocardia sp.]|nr:hypothetical protein [Pseudonocardia sp.]
MRAAGGLDGVTGRTGLTVGGPAREIGRSAGDLLVGPPGPGPWCVSGCSSTSGPDHHCTARLALLARTPDVLGRPRALAVEVDQDADGSRVVVLAPADSVTGRWTGDDPIVLDPATLPALTAALVDAGRVAR